MANQSLARAINYFAVFRIGKVELVDTAQKLCKEEYSATFRGTKEFLFPFSLVFFEFTIFT